MLKRLVKSSVACLAVLIWVVLAGVTTPAYGQPQSTQDTTLITPSEQRETLVRTMSVLNENYVFPEVAERMVASLRERLDRGEYAEAARARTFAERLTEHLYEIGRDRHLWVMVSLGAYPEPPDRTTPEGREAQREVLRRTNFGFQRAEVLAGNVGYLDVRTFRAPEIGGEAAVAAMQFLSNSEALVIDLRRSGGGSADMVVLLASYLFGPNPVHLFDMYRRVEDRTDQYWTLRYVPGERLVDQPLFILTHSRTFSAPEGLAYMLQHLDRATVVGEQTGGGAHPGGFHRLSEHFVMFVASARVTSPVTSSNWEGVGVSPDVEVPAELALETAHKLALEALLRDASDSRRVEELSQRIREIEDRLDKMRAGRGPNPE